MRNPKVLLVLDNLNGGGAQEYVYQLCRHLHPNKVDIDVSTIHSFGIYLAKFEKMGIRVHVFSLTPRIIAILQSIWTIWQVLQREKYDLVHTFLPGSFLVLTPLCWLHGTKTAHSVMAFKGADVPKWYYPSMRLFQGTVEAFFHVQFDEMTDTGILKDKVKIVEVPVDFEPFYALDRSTREAKPEPPVILSVGRLHPDKGHAYIIQAMPDILKKSPHAELRILGDGSEFRNLSNLVNSMGLGKSVRFTGYEPNLDLQFLNADVFVRTSVNEGINITTMMAMAAALPVIGFQTASPKDFVFHKRTGWIVPLRDVSALAQGVTYLLENKTQAELLGYQARKSLQDYYDVTPILRCYSQLYWHSMEGLPIQEIEDMREHIWPIYDPFSKMPLTQ